MPPFHFDNTYARELPGFYAEVRPAPAPAPQLLYLNAALSEALGLDVAALQGDAGAQLFAGNALPEGAQPLAQAYAGHQFGGFSPQLGDGRALLLGEVIDRQGQRRDIAFKGSGRTPYSRGGDGKAAVGPMLRRLAAVYPLSIHREQLAADLGMTPTSGTYSTYLSRLRAPGLIEIDKKAKTIRASTLLMVKL